ncbi:type IX secretion system plug protein domain-containing protein [Fodinibius sp. SL11]|uniref:type IX secretion system plug protein n=1 Tax=Fodinibius sp. SL11 TaxID=3425690 RepID=UPI003F881444
MYLKVHFYSRLIFNVLLAVITVGCAASGPSQQQQFSSKKPLDGSLALTSQKAPPNDIQSIQLYPTGQPQEAPIITLHSGQSLQLSFDYLGTQNRQFRVTIEHFDQSWNKSRIGPNTYLNSFSETTIQSSNISFGQRPSYQHLEFSFPNNELQPAVSGNYLIKVYSTDDSSLLFSMPFFITEDEGRVQTKAERLFAQRNDGRPLEQLFSTYDYPDFVEYPQFDLAMSFVQNRFWGRTKQVEFLDTITPGQLRGYIDHDNAFIGNYEFKRLDLQNFEVDGQQILDYQPGITPPRIILRRDVQNLDTNPNQTQAAATEGNRGDERNSNYAQVAFRLQTDERISSSADIYIVGHFNNWMISDLNKMSFDPDEQMWTGQALIKQGTYAYKYIIVQDNQLDDLSLDQGFLSAQQEYLTFIYFKDPDKNFDRLLKVDRVLKR